MWLEFSFDKTNFMARYKSVMQRNLLTKWLFMGIPFMATIILFVIMYNENVLYSSENKFTFLSDYSNSISCILLFIIGYFFCSSYPRILEESISSVVLNDSKNENIKKIFSGFIIKKSNWLYRIQIFVFWVCILPGTSCMLVAKSNENAFWLQNISILGLSYYAVYLFLTWYYGGIVLSEAIFGCIVVSKLFNNSELISFDEDNKDQIFGHKLLVNYLIMNISVGIYYILSIIVIAFTDYLSYALYDVKNFFYRIPLAGVAIFALVIYILCIFMLPLLECKRQWKNKKRIMIKEYEEQLEDELHKRRPNQKKVREILQKKDNVENINVSVLGVSFSKLPLILSVTVPFVSLIFQIAEFCSMK